MKKAQNLIEVSLVLVLVVLVSVSLWPMFNNSKIKLAGLTKTNLSTQSISGRQIGLKNNALDLASSMGLTINKNEDPKTILENINTKLNEMKANAGTDTSKLAQVSDYSDKYNALSGELSSIAAAAVTTSDNTTTMGAKGGKVNDTVANSSVPTAKQLPNSPDKTGTSGSTTTPPPTKSSVSKTDSTGTTANLEVQTYAVNTNGK